MINNYGSAVAEKSINLATHLPFDENSLIVHSDSNLKITENIPTIDGATALYPVYSAFVEALYPKESVQFDGNDFTLESSIQKTGTTTAFKRVIDGDIDIIFCAQPLKKQLEYAKEKIEDIVEDSNLKMISLDGIYPRIENIRNGTYPIVDNFYMIYRKDNTNENIEKIQNWILSEEGQKIIDETGYTSIMNY